MLTSTLSKEAPFVDVQDGIALAHAIVDTVHDPLVVLDHELRVIAASRSFYNTFRLVRDDVRGHLLYEIDGGQWDIPELRELLGAISNGQATIEGYEVDREFPAIGQRVMLLNARKVFYEKGTHSTVLLAFEDITGRRAIERQVQELLREKDMLLEEMQHRVANSLQIIASILLIKARTVQSEETRLQLEDAHQRVLSVAAVQQHLHVVGGGKPIEIGKYLTKLCETLTTAIVVADGAKCPVDILADATPGRPPVAPKSLFIEIELTDMERQMTVDFVTQLGPAYLRLQADRCQRLSRTSMDFVTARDLRLMSEE